MENIVAALFPLIIVAGVAFIGAPLFNMFIKTFGNSSSGNKKVQDAKYDRRVDSIHITRDAEAERAHRLEQLRSLYHAGMMERDEYNERVAAVEADYRGRH